MTVKTGRKVPWAVLAVLAGMAGAPALANEPAAADVQWAQTILKEKGFNIGGKANGQMTAQTRAALSQYQKSVGLPATGTLDSATVAKMMGDRKTSGTVSNLASQKPGSTPKLTEREVMPRAATRAGDVHSQGGGDVMLGPIVRQAPAGVTVPPVGASSSSSSSSSPGAAQRYTPPPAATSSASPSSVGHSTPSQTGGAGHSLAPQAAVPQRAAVPQAAAPQVADAGPAMSAAPRASVTAATADGKEVPTTLLSKGGDEGGSLAGWLRYVVMAVLAGTLGFVGFGWWRSGRAQPPGFGPSSADNDEDRAASRREPSFTPSRDELMVEPRLGAARGRSR